MFQPIKAVQTPPAVFLQGAPAKLLQQFHFREPVPQVVEDQITWQWYKQHAYRHCLDPRLAYPNNCITHDLRMMRRLGNSRQVQEIQRCQITESRHVERLEPCERWTQFGSGYLPEIEHWLDQHGYRLDAEDYRPQPEELARICDRNYFDSLDENNRRLATRFLNESLAWTQAANVYESAAMVAQLCREQSIVIVMAARRSVLEAFENAFKPRGFLLRAWGNSNEELTSKNIYLSLANTSIPLHCESPVTLIVLGAEELVHHEAYLDFHRLNKLQRQYGFVSTSKRLSGSDTRGLKLLFGKFLDLEPNAFPSYRQYVYSATLSCAIPECSANDDELLWKCRAIWMNQPRNRSIAHLVNAVDGVEALLSDIRLPALSDILVCRPLSKNTIMIVENEEHGRALHALLPNYCLVTRENVNGQGFMTVDLTSPVPGAIITYAAFLAMQTIIGDLVIRVDGGTLQLDTSKITFPVPFQERSQIIIEIAEPKQYGCRRFR